MVWASCITWYMATTVVSNKSQQARTNEQIRTLRHNADWSHTLLKHPASPQAAYSTRSIVPDKRRIRNKVHITG